MKGFILLNTILLLVAELFETYKLVLKLYINYKHIHWKSFIRH